MRNLTVFISFLFIVFLMACDIDTDASPAESIEIAETIVYELNQIKVEKGRVLYEIDAERAETYAAEDLTRIFNMEFTQYDKDGKVVAEGNASKVEYNVETENAVVDGEMQFASVTEGVTLVSSWLEWNNEKKTLTGKDDVPVRLEKESGTVLEGMGFQALTDTKTVSFSKGMKGVFVPDKKSENEDSKNSSEATIEE